MKRSKKFSFLIKENKNHSVNDIFKFLNTGKISKASGKYSNIPLEKNKNAFSLIKKNKSYYKSSYLNNVSLDKKEIYDNSNNSLFGNNKNYNNKKRYVKENFNKVFNYKDYNKTTNILMRNKKENITTTIYEMKKNIFNCHRKSFIEESPSKKYQNTIRINFWTKINYNNNNNDLLVNKKNNNNRANSFLIDEINKFKKEFNKDIINNKSEIKQLMNLYSKKRNKKIIFDKNRY